ncbi:hypothetical protein FRC0549_01729 [Corynebacterium diphtheriae]|nr:hypothetical protein FRC0549_01729 [Corynebacterium diphtheriae]
MTMLCCCAWGQPSTGAPRAVIERVHSRIDASALGYTATLGALSFVRRLLSGMLRRMALIRLLAMWW